MVCVVKNRSKAASAANNGTLDKSSADESVVSDVQRPFVPQQPPAKFEIPAKGSKYPNKYSTSGKWSNHTVYPASGMSLIILIMVLISLHYTLIILNTTLISLNYIFREVALR